MTTEEINHDDCACGECEDCGECGECSVCCPPEDEYEEVGGYIAHQFQKFADYIQERGFHFIGNGGFRNVYRRGNVVIKIPKVGDGVTDNRVEAMAWRKYKNKPTDLGVHLTPCRLLPNGCLMMMAIANMDWNVKPEWANKIDCCQIGSYKGRAVAYDYALDVTERDQWEQEWGHEGTFFQRTWLMRRPYLRKKIA